MCSTVRSLFLPLLLVVLHIFKILFCDAISFSVLEEEIASPVELAKAYMASRPYKVAQRQDLVMHNNAPKIASKLQMVPWVLKMDSQHQDLKADRQRTAWPAHHMPDLLQLLPKRFA
nr:hypothetical protein [Tanacetum cinerariifolium]